MPGPEVTVTKIYESSECGCSGARVFLDLVYDEDEYDDE